MDGEGKLTRNPACEQRQVLELLAQPCLQKEAGVGQSYWLNPACRKRQVLVRAADFDSHEWSCSSYR